MIKFRKLRCSFCRKHHTQVLKLVAGPRVYICDECVAIASRIMADDNDVPPPLSRPTIWQTLAARVRWWFGSHQSRRARLSEPTV